MRSGRGGTARAPLYRKLRALLRGLLQWVQLELEVPTVSGTPLRFLHGHWRPGEVRGREMSIVQHQTRPVSAHDILWLVALELSEV